MQYVIGILSGTGALADDIFQTGNTTASCTPWQATAFMSGTTPGPVASLSRFIRLVSQELIVEQTASATTNGGFYTATSLPGDFGRSNRIGDLTNTQRANLPGVIRSSIADGPVVLRYVPTDNSNLEYTDMLDTPNDNDEEFMSYCPSLMMVMAQGCSPGVTFLVTLVSNWEFLPLTSNSLFGISPSLIDRQALDYALTHAQNLDLASVEPGCNSSERGTMLESSFAGVQATIHPAGRIVLTKGKNSKLSSNTTKSAKMASKAPLGTSSVAEMSLFDHIVEDVSSIAKKVLPALASWLNG